MWANPRRGIVARRINFAARQQSQAKSTLDKRTMPGKKENKKKVTPSGNVFLVFAI
ncbi:MAG: hypothetical protein LBN33_05660 [Desulfovibrio sp.]|nr:hypothetical protein [Desulfovibrio sp.]